MVLVWLGTACSARTEFKRICCGWALRALRAALCLSGWALRALCLSDWALRALRAIRTLLRRRGGGVVPTFTTLLLRKRGGVPKRGGGTISHSFTTIT